MVTPNIANINAFCKSLEGNTQYKKLAKKRLKEYFKPGNNGIGVDESAMEEIVDSLALKLESTINGHISSRYPITPYRINPIIEEFVDKDGVIQRIKYEYKIVVDNDDVYRPSLVADGYDDKNGNHHEGYPEGAYDIVGLFTHGWDAGHRHVYGMWRGDYIPSLSYREPKSFVDDTVESFNSELRRKYGRYANAETGELYSSVE